jgi:two-component system, chemotaxis family, CheB/CheR fusion protein
LSPSLRFDIAPPTAAVRETQNRPLERISYGDPHGRILEQFAPSIVANEQLEVFHVSQKAGRFLQISGELTNNLLKLIRHDLQLAVSTAVYQAVQRQTNVRADHLKL